MTTHLDRYDRELGEGDFVRVGSITDELFRIKGFQFPGDAIIENILPGGRLDPSTLPCADLIKQINNPDPTVRGWDYTYEDPDLSAAARTQLPCGCYLRRPDLEAVLCEQHLIEVNTPAE